MPDTSEPEKPLTPEEISRLFSVTIEANLMLGLRVERLEQIIVQLILRGGTKQPDPTIPIESDPRIGVYL